MIALLPHGASHAPLPYRAIASARVASDGGSFGAELHLLGYAEAVEDSRVAEALRELAALQTLAALSAWPQPEPPPAPAPVAPAVPAPKRTSPPPAARTEPWTDATFSAAVLDLINARRAAAGLAPLRSDARLASAASSYALRMSTLDAFGHSVDGSTLGSRVAAAGFTESVMLGEVIASGSGSPSPSYFVQMWMDSGAHRDQILSGSYSRAGAGCAFDGGTVYCVVDLAG